MAGEVGTGIAGGALSGAGYGAQLGMGFGPEGAAIGAGIGLLGGGLIGAFQGAGAKKLRKAYDAAEKNINPIDPMQVAMLARYRQQERNLRAGTDTASAFAANQARNVAAQTQSNITRAGGPGLVGNLLRSQQALGGTIAGIGANASQGANQMLGAQGALTNLISERAYQLQREIRNIAMERSAAARQGLNNALAGGLAMIPQLAGGFSGGPKAAPTPGNMNTQAVGPKAGISNFGQPQTGTPWNGFQSQANYGFNYQPPAPNYALNY